MILGALAAGGGTVLYAALALAGSAGQAAGWLALLTLALAGTVVVGAAVSVLMLVTARAQARARVRRSWLLLGMGVACWTLAELARGTRLLVGDAPLRPPSTADVGMIAGTALVLAGVLLRPALGPRRGSRRLLLIDATILMAAILALSWPFAIGPLFARSALDVVGQVAIVLPAVAGFGMVATLFLARAWHGGDRRTAWLLIGSLAAWTLGSLAGLVDAASDGTDLAALRGALTIAALGGLGWAAYGDWLVPAEQTEQLDEPLAALGRFALPFLLLGVVTLTVSAAPPAGAVPIGRIALAIGWVLVVARALTAYAALSWAFRYERELRIGHAGSFRQEQQRRRQLEAIRDVSAELTHQLDLATLVDLIARRAAELADASGGAVYLWDDAGQLLVPRAWHNLGKGVAGARLRLGEGAAGVAAAERRGFVIDDYPASSYARAPLPAQAPVSAMLVQPIVYQDQLVGVIVATHERQARTFRAEDLEVLALFSDQAALAIEHAHLFGKVALAEAHRELARLKTELLSTASHELRTPLTLIHGYAELLRMRAGRLSAGEVADMAGEILNGSTTMIRLVDDLLDFARLESHRPVAAPRRADVELLLRRLLDVFRERPGGERIVLDAPTSLHAEVDPSFLQQIVRNLVTNAVNYAPRGPITVRATSRGGGLVVEVADDGPGIPAGERARVWETFYRGEQARVSPHRGSGLGLAVVKQLVDLHGGRAEIESPSGRGATFRIWLPPSRPDPERETTVGRPR